MRNPKKSSRIHYLNNPKSIFVLNEENGITFPKLQLQSQFSSGSTKEIGRQHIQRKKLKIKKNLA